MNIKRELRKQAKDMLPSEDLKNNIRNAIEPQTEVVYANSNSTASRGKTIGIATGTTIAFVVTIIIAVVLGIYLPGNVVTYSPVEELLNGNSYVNIQINPGFEIMVDASNHISNIKATNSDGALVLYGTNYVGMPLEKALKRIIKDADALGFLKDDNDINVITFNEDETKSKQIGKDVKGGLNSYLYRVNSKKDIKVLSNSRDQMETLALNSGLESKDVKTKRVTELARILTGYDENEVNATNVYLESKLSDDEQYNLLKKMVDTVDELEDSIEDILDYIEDFVEEDEDNDDDDSEDDEKEKFNPNKLSDLINIYNSYAVDCFDEYKYNLTIDLQNATTIELKTIESEFKELLGDDDSGVGIDALEDQLENAFNKYKKEYLEKK